MKEHYHRSTAADEAGTQEDGQHAGRIFSKKDKKNKAERMFGNMRKQMHFDTTYRDLYYTYALPKLIS